MAGKKRGRGELGLDDDSDYDGGDAGNGYGGSLNAFGVTDFQLPFPSDDLSAVPVASAKTNHRAKGKKARVNKAKGDWDEAVVDDDSVV